MNPTKQVRLYDKDNDVYLGGILLPDGNIICGCCGAIMTPDEYDETDEDALFIIVDVYEHWIDISDAIIGD